MGIRDHPIAPRSPWQNAYVERLIGSIRRECLDHMIVFGEAHLRRILRGYAAYYNVSRPHRSLNKDAPLHRAVERLGAVVSRTVLGGLHAGEPPRAPYVQQCLKDAQGPFVAATDYMRTVPDQIRQWVPGRYVSLGTDGFGRSDSRAALRRHFEVDRHYIAVAALKALADEGKLEAAAVTAAMKAFGVDPAKPVPWKV